MPFIYMLSMATFALHYQSGVIWRAHMPTKPNLLSGPFRKTMLTLDLKSGRMYRAK